MNLPKQIRLMICSDAGGTGKTTSSIHLAYELGNLGYKTTLIELDSNGSVSTFTGLTPNPKPDETLYKVWDSNFNGDYPIKPIWEEYLSTVNVIQGGSIIDRVIRELPSRGRGHYVLMDRITEEFPLDSDVVIFDTPSTLEPMGVLALVASTHILCPIKPEQKDSEALFEFMNWYYKTINEFKIRPKPEIIGFIPTRVDFSKSTHRKILGIDEKGNLLKDVDLSDTLPKIIEKINIKCFPMIRESNYYLSATTARLPVPLFRPKSNASSDYSLIAQEIIGISKGK